jgi:ABC-type branched-subunit amino acid transport system substrate-binding protein
MTEGSAATIRLGVMLPGSGACARYGQDLAWAVRIACNELNAVADAAWTIEAVVANGAGTRDADLAIAKTLIEQQGCSALIAALDGHRRQTEVSRIAEASGTILFNVAPDDVGIDSRCVFNLSPTPHQECARLIPCMQQLAGSAMFFVGQQDDRTRAWIEAAGECLRQHDGNVVGELYLASGKDRLDDLLDRLQNSEAKVLVPCLAGDEQLNLLTRFAQRGLNRHIAVAMGNFDKVTAARLTPDIRDGIFYACVTSFMSLNSDAKQRYLAALAALPDVDGLSPASNGKEPTCTFMRSAKPSLALDRLCQTHCCKHWSWSDSKPLWLRCGWMRGRTARISASPSRAVSTMDVFASSNGSTHCRLGLQQRPDRRHWQHL